jgi:transcriptional regulator with XRE-family HTH domain
MDKLYLARYNRSTKMLAMDAKKLGKKIKLARIEQELTQGQLAEAIGAMQKSISRYETGISLPSLETLEKIARVLKKPFGYFLDE